MKIIIRKQDRELLLETGHDGQILATGDAGLVRDLPSISIGGESFTIKDGGEYLLAILQKFSPGQGRDSSGKFSSGTSHDLPLGSPASAHVDRMIENTGKLMESHGELRSSVRPGLQFTPDESNKIIESYRAIRDHGQGHLPHYSHPDQAGSAMTSLAENSRPESALIHSGYVTKNGNDLSSRDTYKAREARRKVSRGHAIIPVVTSHYDALSEIGRSAIARNDAR